MAVVGQKSKAWGIGKIKQLRPKNKREITTVVRELMAKRTERLVKSLSEHRLRMIETKPDGNCLFRSISYQLYGTEEHHMEIRELCMKHIEVEKAFFQDFVVENFEDYVKKKSQNGEWGDDVEIQSISEIYGRPIEIYSYEAKPIRTFHEDNELNIQPLKVAYIGFSHYNSINHVDHLNEGVMESAFGEFEKAFMNQIELNKERSENFKRNRTQFSHCTTIEDSLEERFEAQVREYKPIEKDIEELEEMEVSEALKESENKHLEEQIFDSELREIQSREEEAKLAEEIKRIE